MVKKPALKLKKPKPDNEKCWSPLTWYPFFDEKKSQRVYIFQLLLRINNAKVSLQRNLLGSKGTTTQ